MCSMNIFRSWDKTCYEIAHKLDVHDIIDSQYSNIPNGNKIRTYRQYKNELEKSSNLKRM